MGDAVNPAGQQPDQAAVREVFRAQHRLAVSVMERPQEYTVAYSLGDIHRLTFLSHDERSAIQGEWDAWHRKYVRLGRIGMGLWVARRLSKDMKVETGVDGTTVTMRFPIRTG